MQPVRPAQRLERPPQPPARAYAAAADNVDDEDDYSDVTSELESEVISQNFRMLPCPFPPEGGPGPSYSTSPSASNGRGVSPLISEHRTFVSCSSLTTWSGAHVIQNGEQMPWTAGNGLRTFEKLRANTTGTHGRVGMGGGGGGGAGAALVSSVAPQRRPPPFRGSAAAECELTVENLERIRDAAPTPLNLPVEHWKADAQAARRTPPAVIAVSHARSDTAARGLDTSPRPAVAAGVETQPSRTPSTAPATKPPTPTRQHTAAAAHPPQPHPRQQPPPFPPHNGGGVARLARPATTTSPARTTAATSTAAERARAAAVHSAAAPERRTAAAAAVAVAPAAGTAAALVPTTTAASPRSIAAGPAKAAAVGTASLAEARANPTTAAAAAASPVPRRSTKRTQQATSATTTAPRAVHPSNDLAVPTTSSASPAADAQDLPNGAPVGTPSSGTAEAASPAAPPTLPPPAALALAPQQQQQQCDSARTRHPRSADTAGPARTAAGAAAAHAPTMTMTTSATTTTAARAATASPPAAAPRTAASATPAAAGAAASAIKAPAAAGGAPPSQRQPARGGVPGAPAQYTSGGCVVLAARRLPVTAAPPTHSSTLPPTSYAAVAGEAAATATPDLMSTATPATNATTNTTGNTSASPREEAPRADTESLASSSMKTIAPRKARELVVRRPSSEDARPTTPAAGGGPPAPSSAAPATEAAEESRASRTVTSPRSSGRNTRGTASDMDDSEPVLRLHVTPLATAAVPSRSPKPLSNTASAVHVTPVPAATLPPAMAASPNGAHHQQPQPQQSPHAHPNVTGVGAHLPQHIIRPTVNLLAAKPLDVPIVARKSLAVVTVTAPHEDPHGDEASPRANAVAGGAEAAAETGAVPANAARSVSPISPRSTLPLVSVSSRRPLGGQGGGSPLGPVRRCNSRDTPQPSSWEATPSVGSTQPFLSLRHTAGLVGSAGGGGGGGGGALPLARQPFVAVGAAAGASASTALSGSRTVSANSCSSRSTPSFLQDIASGQAGTPVRGTPRQTAATPFALDGAHSARHATPVPAAPAAASPTLATAHTRGRRAGRSAERAATSTSAPRRASGGDTRLNLAERLPPTTHSPPSQPSQQPLPPPPQSRTQPPPPPPPPLLHVGRGAATGAPRTERRPTLEPLDTTSNAPTPTAQTPLSPPNADAHAISPPFASADGRKAAWKASRQVPALRRPLPERRATLATLTAMTAADHDGGSGGGNGGGETDSPTGARVRPGPGRPRSYSVPPGALTSKGGATASPAAAAPVVGATSAAGAAGPGARSSSPSHGTGNAAATPRKTGQGRGRATPGLFTPPPLPSFTTASQQTPPTRNAPSSSSSGSTDGNRNRNADDNAGSGSPASGRVDLRSPLDNARLTLRSPLSPTSQPGRASERSSHLPMPATTTSTTATTPHPVTLSPPALARRASDEALIHNTTTVAGASAALAAAAAAMAESRPSRLPALQDGALTSSPQPPQPPPSPEAQAASAAVSTVPAPAPTSTGAAVADTNDEKSLTMESLSADGAVSIAPARRRTVARVRGGSTHSDNGVESGSVGGGGGGGMSASSGSADVGGAVHDEAELEAAGHARQRVVPPFLDAEHAWAAERVDGGDGGEGREQLRHTSSRRVRPARRRRSTDMQLFDEEVMRTV